jgi:hypothetical protein
MPANSWVQFRRTCAAPWPIAVILKPGVTLKVATDVLWTYSSSELYELLVVRCGWDAARYGQFIGDSLAAALLR